MAKTFVPRKWLGLLSLMPALAVVFIDQAVLPVALPTIQKHFGATHTQLWWCVNSYLLVSAVLLLAGGKIGDRIGYRQAFLWGLAIFTFASTLCGLSFDIQWLIGARALQGVGAALMIPTSSPIIMSLFPQNERGKALGINVSVSSLFLIIAPLIGGYFTQALSWRWIFWINLPLAITGFSLVPLFIPLSPKRKEFFDPWGFLFFVLSATALVMLIMQGSDWGWTSLTSGLLLAVSLITAFLLFWREKHSPIPFIDLSLFRHPIYKAVAITLFVTQFVLMTTVYRAVFFQYALDWSPLKSGTIFCLTSTPILFMSPIGGWLADRLGSKIPITLGFCVLISSFFWLAFVVQDSLLMILLGLLAFGIGVPLIFTPSYSAAMGSIPPKKAGSAFGTLATIRALSSTFGVAVITSFATHIQLSSFGTLIEEDPKTKMLNPSFLESLATGVQKIKGYLSAEQLQLVLRYLKESQIKGFFITHLVMGALLLIAFIFVFLLYHRKPSHHLPEAPAEGWD